jgi:5'-3' exonuclease
MARTLYVIDGHSQIYRAYYAPFGNLSSPSGEPTRATHVFSQMLLNLLRNRRPDYLAMALDVDDRTVFRVQIYPEYKAQRQLSPEDLPVQMDRIISIVQAVGIPILRVPGFEADDIIATLAARLAGPDLTLYAVSRDKDLDQILSPHVALYDPLKDEVITAERLPELKGWTPEQAIDAQVLIGDDVDNVSGVAGIGPKTAAKLLQKYGSAEEVIAHAHELTPKQRENVLAFAPRLEISRQLMTLRRDVPLEFDLERPAASELTGPPPSRSSANSVFAGCWTSCRPRRALRTTLRMQQPQRRQTSLSAPTPSRSPPRMRPAFSSSRPQRRRPLFLRSRGPRWRSCHSLKAATTAWSIHPRTWTNLPPNWPASLNSRSIPKLPPSTPSTPNWSAPPSPGNPARRTTSPCAAPLAPRCRSTSSANASARFWPIPRFARSATISSTTRSSCAWPACR